MIYIASPYSHPDPVIMRTRFLLAQEYCAALINQGEFPYSPIVHCHEMALRYKLPTDFEYWRNYNLDMLRRADSMTVMTIPGWEESVGVKAETAAARAVNLPVFYMSVEAWRA